jgi:Intracellular proteinase inhibitor
MEETMRPIDFRVCVLMIALILTAPVARANEGPSRGTPIDEPVVGAGSLTVTLTADQGSYPLGRPVQMELGVRNVSTQPITLRFSSTFQYDFRARAVPGGRVVWQWSRGRRFLAVESEKVLQPGETAAEIAFWKPQVPAGVYALDAVLNCADLGPLIPRPVLIRIGAPDTASH